ncbi:hypothetical protein EMN47_01670 [Prolixibacteraceae bacterium JC049]|nr:hypothetical protein [Prolixibacteraceae bacterium JC049]
MKKLLAIPLLLIKIAGYSQTEAKSSFKCKGIVLGLDSIPIEHAYIINTRNYMFVASKPDGRFTINVQKGDSLVISHISYARTIIYPKDSTLQLYPLQISAYEMSPIVINEYEKEKKHLEKMMTQIKKQVTSFKPEQNQPPSDINPYNPESNRGASVNLLGFVELAANFISKKQKQRNEKLTRIKTSYRTYVRDSLLKKGVVYSEQQIDSLIATIKNRKLIKLNKK